MSLQSASNTDLNKSQNQLPAPGSHKLHSRFRAQFLKTELCRFFENGSCWRGAQCGFAHGKEELQAPPDLNKTSMCKDWLLNQCQLPASECPFAHGSSELRLTQVFKAAALDERIKRREVFCKTQICRFFEEGECLKGSKCEFAHGELDVRILPETRKQLRGKEMSKNASNAETRECRLSKIDFDRDSNSTDARSRLQNLGTFHLQSMGMADKSANSETPPEKAKMHPGSISGQEAVTDEGEADEVQCVVCMSDAGQATISPQCPANVQCIACMIEAGQLPMPPQHDVGGFQCVACMLEAGCSMDQVQRCRLSPKAGHPKPSTTIHMAKDVASNDPNSNVATPKSRGFPLQALLGYNFDTMEDESALHQVSVKTRKELAVGLQCPKHKDPESSTTIQKAKDVASKRRNKIAKTPQSQDFQSQAPLSSSFNPSGSEEHVQQDDAKAHSDPILQQGVECHPQTTIHIANELAPKYPSSGAHNQQSCAFQPQSPFSFSFKPMENAHVVQPFNPLGSEKHVQQDDATAQSDPALHQGVECHPQTTIHMANEFAPKYPSSDVNTQQRCAFQPQSTFSFSFIPAEGGQFMQPMSVKAQSEPAAEDERNVNAQSDAMVRLLGQSPDLVKAQAMDVQQLHVGMAAAPYMVSEMMVIPARVMSQVLQAAMPDQYED